MLLFLVGAKLFKLMEIWKKTEVYKFIQCLCSKYYRINTSKKIYNETFVETVIIMLFSLRMNFPTR
jgi:hypothetical protein